jgi:hypothetical protein
MAIDRRQRILLGVLVALLAVYGGSWWLSGPAVPASGTSKVRGGAAVAGSNAGITAPDVHLEALKAERPRPGAADRNLFRFAAKAPPPAPPARDRSEQPPPIAGPPAGPTVAPITLKFLGVMEVSERSLRVAVLSDGRGVYNGVEGGVIEGRYRIIRIGTESIEMANLDGSGRQVIRLSGS